MWSLDEENQFSSFAVKLAHAVQLHLKLLFFRVRLESRSWLRSQQQRIRPLGTKPKQPPSRARVGHSRAPYTRSSHGWRWCECLQWREQCFEPCGDSHAREIRSQDSQDIPSILALLSSDIFLCTLPSPFGQSRWAHLQILPGQSRAGLPVQLRCEYRMRPGWRADPVDGSSRRGWYLLWLLQDHIGMEIRAGIRVQSEIQGGQVHHRACSHDQRERLGEWELMRQIRQWYWITWRRPTTNQGRILYSPLNYTTTMLSMLFNSDETVSSVLILPILPRPRPCSSIPLIVGL